VIGPPAGVVGRSVEVERLLNLTRQASSGQGYVVLVEGGPGFGKTTLLELVAAESERLGARVLSGGADEQDRRPFAAIRSCLGLRTPSPRPELARVSALLRGDEALVADGAVDREFAVSEAVSDLAEHWCAERPLVLLMDNLQWADASSLLVFNRLGRIVGRRRMLVGGAYRPAPRREELDGLLHGLDACGAVTLPLGPLDEPAVATVVERLLGSPPGHELLELVGGAAGGNPRYVTELVDALHRGGRIALSGGMAAVVDGAGGDATTAVGEAHGRGPAGSLVEVIRHRLDLLSRQAREVLPVAATLGPTVDVMELSAVLGAPVVELWDAMSEAIVAGLLSDDGDELVFRQDLIRQALAEELPVAIRTALGARAGHALASAGAPVERVAIRLLAGTGPDAGMLDWLIQAGDKLSLRAPDAAVELLERAVARPELDNSRRSVARLQLARALLWADRPVEAERGLRAALSATHDPAQDIELRWLLAHACRQQGLPSHAVAAAEQALTSAQPLSARAARLHGFIAQCLPLLGQSEAGDAAADRALAAAEASCDSYGIAYGQHGKAVARLLDGRADEGLWFADRALKALGAQEIPPDMQLFPHAVRGACLVELDRLAEAEAAYETGVRSADRVARATLSWNHTGRAVIRYLDGRWDDALAEIRTGLDTNDPLGDLEGMQCQAALITMHRGDFATYAGVVRQRHTGQTGPLGDYLRLSARVLAWEGEGHPERALRALAGFWPGGDAQAPLRPLALTCLGPDLVRLAVAVGDMCLASRVAAVVDELVARHPTPGGRAAAALCRGLAESDPAQLLAAAEAYHESSRPLASGHAYENAATVLAEQGRVAEARAAFEAGVERYERLSAAWDTSRAEARLRRAGLRHRRGSRRPKTGWDALTETEGRIVPLVAVGRRNADIAAELCLSRRTVENSVSRILAKLELTSRVELAVAAHDRSRSADWPRSADRPASQRDRF
jgi:DNA-binding CsgD family transcriptional regulator/tetratricopeptide (TPR) repeat protein